MKKQWRFKTEKEFIAEYGPDWKNRVLYTWAIEMNYLLGEPFEGKLPTDKEEGTCKEVSDWPWSISKDMLTTRVLPKYLRDGTLAKVGMKLTWIGETDEGEYVIVNKINTGDNNTIRIQCCCRQCRILSKPRVMHIVKLKYLAKFQKPQ